MKPVQAKGNESPARKRGNRPGHQRPALMTQKPESARRHHQHSQPRNLAGGAEDRICQRRKTYPHRGRGGTARLQRAQAAIKTDHDGKQALYIGHESDRERHVERRQYDRKSADRRIPLVDACSNKGALNQKSSQHCNQKGRQASSRKGKAE